jgi:hypothetical protein
MNYSGMGNRLVAQQVTLSQSATIQSLSYYVATTGGQLRLGIYNNSGSAPGALVAQTAAFTPVAGWNTQAVTTPVSLSPGTYWLVFLPQNNTLAGRLGLSGIRAALQLYVRRPAVNVLDLVHGRHVPLLVLRNALATLKQEH